MSPIEIPEWPRAHGDPLFAARLRAEPGDFEVTEQLGWEFSGDGEHDYLWIEKTGANTEWVARQLASHADVPAKDVGYAGLKDRQAVTRQWFSIPRWHAPDWSLLAVDGVRVLDQQRHLRKLRRGAHRANDFRIVLRSCESADTSAIQQRLRDIRNRGVPNYYGEQRFGRGGGNLQLAEAWTAGKRLPRHKRSLAISTLRSYLFNQTLADRVRESTWDQLVTGDLANLAGSGSVFTAEAIDDDLRKRCLEMDIHPAAVLAGDGSHIGPEPWRRALDRARVEPGSRSLRLCVADLAVDASDGSLALSFTLGRGAFATAVLRELCTWS